jgi:hypothetical protein
MYAGRFVETASRDLAQLPPGYAFALPSCHRAVHSGEMPVTLSCSGAMVRCICAVPVAVQEVSA